MQKHQRRRRRHRCCMPRKICESREDQGTATTWIYSHVLYFILYVLTSTASTLSFRQFILSLLFVSGSSVYNNNNNSPVWTVDFSMLQDSFRQWWTKTPHSYSHLLDSLLCSTRFLYTFFSVYFASADFFSVALPKGFCLKKCWL